MTESIQILLCPHCGATDIKGNVNVSTTHIHSCDNCKNETDETDEIKEECPVVVAFRTGFNCALETRVPEGWQLVPVKPSANMLKATYPLILRSPETIYAAMISSAPVCDLCDFEHA